MWWRLTCWRGFADVARTSVASRQSDLTPAASLLFGGTWSEKERAVFARDMRVHRDFITQDEEASLMDEVSVRLKRQRYEFDHWDDAIHGFREIQCAQWSERNAALIERIRRTAAILSPAAIGAVHVLDLAEHGVIKPHVDSVRFCGPVIAGVSLLSPAVMRLVHTGDANSSSNNNSGSSGSEQDRRHVDCLLTRRSLYIMKDSARYCYTHQVLAGEQSRFGDWPVQRSRRVSLICRCLPPPPDAHSTS